MEQAIPHPNGITVRGNSELTIDPDQATLHYRVSAVAIESADAFANVQTIASKMQSYLDTTVVEKVVSSRVRTQPEYETHKVRGHRQVGFRATITYQATVTGDLSPVEAVIAGLLQNGIESIDHVKYDTTERLVLEAQARKSAVVQARKRAEDFAEAAEVSLGTLVHIEDTNRSHQAESGQMMRSARADKRSTPSLAPDQIRITASVIAVWAIQ